MSLDSVRTEPQDRRMSGAEEVCARRVVVHGRVQGVFFRDTTQRQAAARRVAGWVRNQPDGTVEAVFEGDPHAVEALVAFCHQGPRGAEVDRVEVREEQPKDRWAFEIR
jgi:acylphosphatase